MKTHTFKRGVSVPTHKTATEGHPTEVAPVPKTVYIPVNQHFGAPNKALVAAGDEVKRGQIIAEPAKPGSLAVPVHASIGGKVKKVEDHLLSNNVIGPCIIIEGDGTLGEEAFLPPLDPYACSREDALKRICDAGIIGEGGAGFPTHIKLQPKDPVDTLIADGAECEPYLTTDEACITANPGLLIDGIGIVMHITGIKKAIIGMEDNKAELVPVLEQEIAKAGKAGEISVGLCATRYPQGGEKMLITALTGREVPSGGLPASVGCIVDNVGTLAAISEAFRKGKPVVDRSLTVSGGACKTPKNTVVPVGTLPSELIASGFIQYDEDTLRKILFGGPMMGFAVPNLDIPIQKNNNGLILMTAAETTAYKEGTCIRCGRCLAHCPMRLSPVLMNEALTAAEEDEKAFDEAAALGLMDCIECGACSYICPARIRLTQRFRVGKGRLRARPKK